MDSNSSSDDEDVPVAQRAALIRAKEMANEIEGVSPPPEDLDWMLEKQTPSKADLLRPSPDEDDESVIAEEMEADEGGNRSGPKAKEEQSCGEVVLTLPEKLRKNACLLELDAKFLGASNLTGDTGVIGRVVEEPAEEGEMQTLLDWKGSLFKAKLLPMVGAVFVAHVNGAEAKVENIFDSCLMLEAIGDEEPVDRQYALYDSDDNHMDSPNEGAKHKEIAKLKVKPKIKKPVAQKGTKKGASKKGAAKK